MYGSRIFDKLKKSILLDGTNFMTNSAALYLMYFQYVGTEGVGSNIIKKCNGISNSYKCCHDFYIHFWNKAYLDNKEDSVITAIANYL